MKVKKFLYKVEVVICKDPVIDIEVRANILGEDGWKMVTAFEPVFAKESEFFILILIFKKKIK